MTDRTDDTVRGRLDSAVNGSFDDGDVPLKWLLLVEVMAADGVRDILTVSSPEVRTWDALGLLRWAQMRADHRVASAFREDDDDA